MTFDLMGESLYNDTAGGIGGFANATAPPTRITPARPHPMPLPPRSVAPLRPHPHGSAPRPRQVDKLQLFFDDREALLTIPSTHSPLIERVP